MSEVLKNVGNAILILILGVFLAIYFAVGIITFARAWLVGWINKREKRQAHEDAVEEVLQEHYSQEEIDWIIRGGKRKQTGGFPNTFASIAAKHVTTWKEWGERDLDH
jgi:hypothetical protein